MYLAAMAARQTLIERLTEVKISQWSAERLWLRDIAANGFAGFSHMDNATLIDEARYLGVEVEDLVDALQPTALVMSSSALMNEIGTDAGGSDIQVSHAEAPIAWKSATLAGRCLSGCERDRGSVVHAVSGSGLWLSATSLCGKTHGKRSAGWSDRFGEPVNCPRCLKKLAANSPKSSN